MELTYLSVQWLMDVFYLNDNFICFDLIGLKYGMLCVEVNILNRVQISTWQLKSMLFNSLWPSNMIWWHRPWSALVLAMMMMYCLFGMMPLPDQMLTYCQLYPEEHSSIQFYWNLKSFHSRKCIWKWCLWNCMLFVQASILSHCGLVTPYDDKDLGQHWLR